MNGQLWFRVNLSDNKIHTLHTLRVEHVMDSTKGARSQYNASAQVHCSAGRKDELGG